MAEVDDTQQDDFGKVQQLIKDQVKTAYDEYHQQQLSRVQQSQGQTEQDIVRKHVGEMISPFIDPKIDQATLTANDAKDEVRFYRRNPDAIDYEEQIEEIFTQSVKEGRPTSRATIYNYVVGKEVMTAPEKFESRQQARKQAQLDRVHSAGDFGADSATRQKVDNSFKDFAKLPLDEMETMLEGVTF